MIGIRTAGVFLKSSVIQSEVPGSSDLAGHAAGPDKLIEH